MSRYRGNNRGSGCVPAAALFILFLILAERLVVQVLPLVACFLFPVLVFFLIRWLSSLQSARQVSREAEAARRIVENPRDVQLERIERLHGSVMELLNRNKSHPIVKATNKEIRSEAQELLEEARQLARTRDQIRGLLVNKHMIAREVADLRSEVETEDNPKVRSVLESTLERREAELSNNEKLEGNVRYFEALLEQAEATMSELQSRIGVALTETEDYTNPRARLAVSEASRELRSVSDAMRETLNEIDTTG